MVKNSKLKLFIENMFFYGGLSMLTKALPFITLPIITKLLPDASNYGVVDMFNVINSFGVAIAIMGLYDGMFREFFEDKENKEYQKLVTSTTLNLVLKSSIIMGLIATIFRNKLSYFLFQTENYSTLIIISGITIFLGAIDSILAAPTRMRNNRRIYLFTGVAFPLVGFLLTYHFIKIGYTYEGLIFGTLGMNIISVIFFLFINRKDFNLKIYDNKVAKELLKIGLPLLPTFLIYWVFNSMDRIMINKMLGTSELGVYSVGAKVASVSQLVYTAFAGGFAYFKFSTMSDSDQVNFNTKIFEYLGLISVIIFIVAHPFIKPVFNLFFKGDYIRGNEVFSYLFLSPLILMLFQVISSQMMIIKRSYYITVSLIIGLVLNFILNYFLIKILGIKGAAFSTLISYVVSLIIMIYLCLKYKLLNVTKNFYFIFGLIFLSTFIECFFSKEYYIIYLIVLIYMLTAYWSEIKDRIKGGL